MLGRPNTAVEQRAIAEAIAASRLTICPPGVAAGLSRLAVHLWPDWQLVGWFGRFAEAGRRGASTRWRPVVGAGTGNATATASPDEWWQSSTG